MIKLDSPQAPGQPHHDNIDVWTLAKVFGGPRLGKFKNTEHQRKRAELGFLARKFAASFRHAMQSSAVSSHHFMAKWASSLVPRRARHSFDVPTTT